VPWQQTRQPADRAAEPFQGLLLRHRGRTGLTQRQLAARVGVSRGSVQDWEAGLNYPDAKHLQALIVAFLEAGGLTVEGETAEAEALWDAALRQAPRMQTPFDPIWWANVLTARNASADTSPARPSALAKRHVQRHMRRRKHHASVMPTSQMQSQREL
jgi:transcriptional regulator with XRE-family HTH domain